MSLDPKTRERIQQLVDGSPVLLFMKGDRGQPQCGFSARVVAALDSHGAEYETVDVLADPALREGIKAFSEWPTVPQLYVNGEFIGGCDIVTDCDPVDDCDLVDGMHGSGELQHALERIGS